MFRAVLDTCVLFKPLLCDTLLSIAEDGLYQPLWSVDILAELRRNLLAYGIAEAPVERRIGHMTDHFPGSTLDGYQQLVPAMTNDPKDRHVIAAAIHGSAELIVTENVRDFPASSVKAFDIEISTQDEFLLDQLDLAPRCVHNALVRQTSRYRRTPRTVDDLLIALGHAGNGCPGFASRCHAQLSGG